MRATALAAGSTALLVCLLGSASSAQEVSRRAPTVRVYSQDGGGVISNYVTPAVEVSEDAYVFAVMMDLDGRIQVLHPDFPGISVRLRSHKKLHLPNFFAGFNASMEGAGRYANGLVSYDNFGRAGDDTRGTVIALASRAPFNIELIEANGDWDIAEIRRLIEYRTPSAAAHALAKYLGAKGEPIGRDYMRFAGQRQSYYAYDNLAYCGYGYGYGSMGAALSIARALNRDANNPSARFRPVVVGYDACGFPVVFAQAVAGNGVRLPPPPRRPGDTTVFPKSRLPSGIGRHPGSAELRPTPVPLGIFPLPQRYDPERGDGSMSAPQVRRVEPRAIPDGIRSQPLSTTHADRPRAPVETNVHTRAEPASGAMPVYRAEPRVIERAEPARAPAPVVHERPIAPPPPPPRVQEPVRAAPPPPPKTEPSAPPSKKQ